MKLVINKNGKIYVAGHKGMVGSAILRRLQADGYRDVVVRDRKELDLLDQSAVNRFFGEERPEVVFLAAARVGGIMANSTNQAAFLYENLQIQNNVIHAAHKYGVDKFVFLGSSCIYPRDCPQPIKEEYFLTGPFEPTNEGYAIAKIAGMKLCSYLSNERKWDCITVIPCNLYGPNDNFDPNSSHVMAALVKRFVDAVEFGERVVTCWGTGSPKREFLHVDDLVSGIFLLLRNNPYGNAPVNIGAGNDLTIKELAEIIASQSGFKGEIAWDRTKPDGTPRKLMDVSKMSLIHFQTEIGILKGVQQMIGIYKERKGVGRGAQQN